MLRETLPLRRACAEQGVIWGYGGALYDLREREARFKTGLDALLAEEEAASISARVLRTTRAQAEAGRPHGPNLYGYQRVYDQLTHQLKAVEVVEPKAKIVRAAAQAVLEGASASEVARQLNTQQPPTPTGNAPRHWTGTRIRQMLTSAAYAGYREHRGMIVGRGIWPPILDKATWERLQPILRPDPARRIRRRGPRALLAGIAYCGVDQCGRALYVGQNTRRATREHPQHLGYRVYRCPANHVSIATEEADREVRDRVLDLAHDPAHLALRFADDRAARDKVEAIRNEIERALAFLQAVRDRALRDDLPELIAPMQQTVHDRVSKLRQSIVDVCQVPPLISALASARDLEDHWDSLASDERRRLVAALLTVNIVRSERRQSSSMPRRSRIALRWTLEEQDPPTAARAPRPDESSSA